MSQQPPEQGMQGPALVPFAPLPSVASVGHVQVVRENAEGKKLVTMVQVALADPSGIKVHFFDPDIADKIAKDIARHAWQAKTGIQVVGNSEPIQKSAEMPDGKRPES